MLPNEIGRFTMERAAFHEASHAVCVWKLGGSVEGIEIAFDDAAGEWQGAMAADPLPNPGEQAEMLLAGGFGEARYVANVYDQADWLINGIVSSTALNTAFAAVFPVTHANITFAGANNASKVLEFHLDTFSNDWHRAMQIAQQHNLNLIALARNAIDRINDATVWAEIIRLANRFLLMPPRILTWRFGPDNQIDANKKKYLIEPIQKGAKEKLGAD